MRTALHRLGVATAALAFVLGCAGAEQAGPKIDKQPVKVPAVVNTAAPAAALKHGPCEADKAYKASGLFECKDGRVHRPAVVECPSTIADDSAEKADPNLKNADDRCNRNADCSEKPNGYCAAEGQLPSKMCHYGCTKDSDCGAGALCMCDNPVGRCLPAACLSDKECGEGLLCSRFYALDDMDYGAFACDTTADECNTDDDCRPGEGMDRSCVQADGVRKCVVGARPVY